MVISSASSNLEVCAGVLALFALQLNSLPPDQQASVRYLCESAPSGAPRLDSFVTCLWGTALSDLGAGLAPQSGQMVARFLGTTEELDPRDIERLLGLLQRLLAG